MTPTVEEVFHPPGSMWGPYYVHLLGTSADGVVEQLYEALDRARTRAWGRAYVVVCHPQLVALVDAWGELVAPGRVIVRERSPLRHAAGAIALPSATPEEIAAALEAGVRVGDLSPEGLIWRRRASP